MSPIPEGSLHEEVLKNGYGKLLQSQSVGAAVASVAFTNMDNSYDTYLYDFIDVACSADNQYLVARVSWIGDVNNFRVDPNYFWGRMNVNLNSTSTGGPINSGTLGGVYVTYMQITTQLYLGTGASGEFLVHRSNASNLTVAMMSHYTGYNATGNATSSGVTGGTFWYSGMVAGIQFFFQGGGNISRGRFNQYGVRKGV